MKAQTEVLFVDTNIIPDRNAGIGSLLFDLQNSQEPDRDEPPLLGSEFAFIDVGVSRAVVSIALKTLLTRDLGMEVKFVATELPAVVPYANVTPPADRVEKIRRYLSAMISTGKTMREIMEWHYVVDREGKVSSVVYSYNYHGNEVWESYFMGRTFMVSGEKVEFLDPKLNEMLAYDVEKIETRIYLEMKQDGDFYQSELSREGYRIIKNPLETGLAQYGITLQMTDIPQRIERRQNVLYLGNVLNHYPKNAQDRELGRISANMQEGDIVIVQADEESASFINVLLVKGQGAGKKLERVRWINTSKLEILKPALDIGTWRVIHLKPVLDRIVSRLIDCIGRKMISPERSKEDHKVFVQQYIHQVFGTFFRALPDEETLRISIRKALRRLTSERCPIGIPVFKGDKIDVFGSVLGPDLSPIVSEEDLIYLKTPSIIVAGEKEYVE